MYITYMSGHTAMVNTVKGMRRTSKRYLRHRTVFSVSDRLESLYYLEVTIEDIKL